MKPKPRRKGRAVGVSCIYTLSDEDGVVRYVGQTKDSKRRAWLHGNRANNGGTRPINHWARRLIDQGRKPVLTVIEVTTDLDTREKHWVSHYRAAGANLLNLTDGGQDTSYIVRRAKRIGRTPIQAIRSEFTATARSLRAEGFLKEAEYVAARHREFDNKVGRICATLGRCLGLELLNAVYGREVRHA